MTNWQLSPETWNIGEAETMQGTAGGAGRAGTPGWPARMAARAAGPASEDWMK